MSDRNSTYLGKKYACPGCQSKFKFRRAPTSLLQTCPNCRRKLRLNDQAAVVGQDAQIRQAIESMSEWDSNKEKAYNYRKDPGLNRVESSAPGVWVFDQPWPQNAGDVVLERVQVIFNPDDVEGSMQSRLRMLNGSFRRVSVFHTRRVESMEVTGHWWDSDLREGKVGMLPRLTVRKLNLIVEAKQFAARINCLEKSLKEDREVLELFVDLAIDKTPKKQPKNRFC